MLGLGRLLDCPAWEAPALPLIAGRRTEGTRAALCAGLRGARIPPHPKWHSWWGCRRLCRKPMGYTDLSFWGLTCCPVPRDPGVGTVHPKQRGFRAPHPTPGIPPTVAHPVSALPSSLEREFGPVPTAPSPAVCITSPACLIHGAGGKQAAGLGGDAQSLRCRPRCGSGAGTEGPPELSPPPGTVLTELLLTRQPFVQADQQRLSEVLNRIKSWKQTGGHAGLARPSPNPPFPAQSSLW